MSALANDIANAGTDFFAFVGGDATTVENNISNLTGWLQNVFWFYDNCEFYASIRFQMGSVNVHTSVDNLIDFISLS